MLKHLKFFSGTRSVFCRHLSSFQEYGDIQANRQPVDTRRSKNSLKSVPRDWSILDGVSAQLRKTVFLNNKYGKTLFSNNISDELITAKLLPDEERSLGHVPTERIIDILKAIAADADEDVDYHRSILADIETECASRIEKEDITTHLLLADLFFCSKHKCGKFLRRLLQYYTTAWDNLSLNPPNVIQLLFHIATFRNAPIVIMRRIETYLVDHFDKIDVKECSIICYSFFVSNTRILNYTLLMNIAEKVLEDFDEMPLTLLTNILKGFKHAGFSELDFFLKLGDLISESERLNEPDVRISTLLAILSAYGSARVSHGMFPLLLDRLEMLMNRTGVRSKDLVRLFQFCVTFSIDVPDRLVKMLINELSQTSQQEDFPENLVSGLQNLVLLGIYPTQLLDATLAPLFVNRKIKRKLSQFSNLLFIDTAVGIEVPEYVGNRLAKRFFDQLPESDLGNLGLEVMNRTGLAAVYFGLSDLLGPTKVKCHFILPFSKIADIEIHLDTNGQAIHIPMAGGEDESSYDAFGKMRRILDDQNSTDEVGNRSVISQLLEEHSDKPISLDNRLTEIPSISYNGSEQKPTPRKISIRIMGQNQYIRNKPVLTGTHQMELRLLNAHGYETIVISPMLAVKLSKMNQSKRCLFVKENVIDTF